ncbi:response regulator [Marisediminicola sp. LYQ134]|uniref:response regulator n=1 Tax=unclassified Marisediminicola TaxID=2618316 RepID=UPI0039830BE9
MAENYRVVVIEDDVDVANYTATVLEKRLGCTVIAVTDPREARAAVRELRPDVVITDIEMPGMSGLDLVEHIRDEQPGTPIVVMTAHVSVDYAVTALRNRVDEFVNKPVSSADLVSIVTRLAEESRAAAAARAPETVLAIGAHPDDVGIGVGGILAAHRAAGDHVTVLTLSGGRREGGIATAWAEGSAAAATIGAVLILEDQRDSEVASVEHNAAIISRVLADVTPTIVYLPSANDRDGDRRAVSEAARSATSSVDTGAARTVACYQSPTATVDFRPNRFVSIDDVTEAKLSMLACFAASGERPASLDPDLVIATARYWSRFGAGGACEPLEIVRDSVDVG